MRIISDKEMCCQEVLNQTKKLAKKDEFGGKFVRELMNPVR